MGVVRVPKPVLQDMSTAIRQRADTPAQARANLDAVAAANVAVNGAVDAVKKTFGVALDLLARDMLVIADAVSDAASGFDLTDDELATRVLATR